MFGPSAADASERSSAPTVVPLAKDRPSIFSPFDQQPPTFAFPPASPAVVSSPSFPRSPSSPGTVAASADASTLILSAAPLPRDENSFSLPEMNAVEPWPRYPFDLSALPPASSLPPLPFPDSLQQPQPSSNTVTAAASFLASDALPLSSQRQTETFVASPAVHSPFPPVTANIAAPSGRIDRLSSGFRPNSPVASSGALAAHFQPAAPQPAASSQPAFASVFPPVTTSFSSEFSLAVMHQGHTPLHGQAAPAMLNGTHQSLASSGPSSEIPAAHSPAALSSSEAALVAAPTPAVHSPPPPISSAAAPNAALPGQPPASQAAQLQPPLSSNSPRVVFTEEAAAMMIRLHQGELDLQPLDAQAAGIPELINQVEAAALERFGSPLRGNMALSALEVSRNMPGASGFPQLEEALSCLRLRPSRPAFPPPPIPFSQEASAPPPPAVAVSARPPSLRPGVLSALMPPPTAPAVQRIALNSTAQRELSLLRSGAKQLLPPLGETQVTRLVRNLQDYILYHFGPSVLLEHRTALEAVELSRYLPHASGQPSVAGVLSCLEQPLRPPTAPAVPRPLTTFSRRPSGDLPPPLSGGFIAPPPSNSQLVNASLLDSTRFKNFAPPSLLASTSRSRGRVQHAMCASCGVTGHDAFHCPQGIDVSAVVTAAQELGRASQQRIFELSGCLQPGDTGVNQVVRDEVVNAIAEISGINNLDISSHLDGTSGDAESTFVSAVCHSRGGPDSQFFQDACTRELHRRRHHDRIADASRLASSAPDDAAAYLSLASNVNLPAQLGYGYRAGSAHDLQLPPLPSRPVQSSRRRRDEDDLSDFIVDDHSSEPEDDPTPPPPRKKRSRNASSSESSQSDSSGSGVDDGDDAGNSRSSSQQPSRESGDGDDSYSDRGSDGSGEDDPSSDSGVRGKVGARANHSSRNPDVPLTADSLGKILKTLLDKRSDKSSNNGLLASKTPSFWDLGKAPVGGYFAPTFSKVYGEFRQFRNVFGKNTGVTFKNLIMEDMIPMIRDDLSLSRRDWRKISDTELIRKLKRRLGFRERDAYIAELESCPRLTSGIRDVHVLNNKFKEMAAQMLSICERARTHGVKLKKPSCKHVFGEAVKNCYRVNQWFRLRPFKSIGDSVRDINSKLARRLASAAEQRHENAMDEAKLNGVRHQIGAGTSEGSNAPDRKKGKVKGGVDKKGQDKSKSERDQHSKKMDALYKIENSLEKGRFWHAKTLFCEGDNCTQKFCQGCGAHQILGKPWHDRPRCNSRKHPDFVETGYFHDKWPNRVSIHDKSSKDSGRHQSQNSNPTSTSNSNSNRANYAARSNSLAADEAAQAGNQ